MPSGRSREVVAFRTSVAELGWAYGQSQAVRSPVFGKVSSLRPVPCCGKSRPHASASTSCLLLLNSLRATVNASDSAAFKLTCMTTIMTAHHFLLLETRPSSRLLCVVRTLRGVEIARFHVSSERCLPQTSARLCWYGSALTPIDVTAARLGACANERGSDAPLNGECTSPPLTDLLRYSGAA
ncbi:hypothetical protein BD414DRAFT_26215 [Trametes punicea]|nr:hypothetical protein BD414DRAFT_26215 [Trametes punicea]